MDATDGQEGRKDPGLAIDIDEVMRRIPHRYPFLLVDRAYGYVPHTSIVGVKCVTINEPYFVGHFPNKPVMPGVLQIEAIAQTGGVLMSKTLDVDITRHTILFMAVDGVRFRRPVVPGDVLEMPVEVTMARRNIFKFKGRALVNGEVACEAEFAAMKGELPQP
jgi:3-hydroxyacyl-[acyl-carrier-protein] dehydratase